MVEMYVIEIKALIINSCFSIALMTGFDPGTKIFNGR